MVETLKVNTLGMFCSKILPIMVNARLELVHFIFSFCQILNHFLKLSQAGKMTENSKRGGFDFFDILIPNAVGPIWMKYYLQLAETVIITGVNSIIGDCSFLSECSYFNFVNKWNFLHQFFTITTDFHQSLFRFSSDFARKNLCSWFCKKIRVLPIPKRNCCTYITY